MFEYTIETEYAGYLVKRETFRNASADPMNIWSFEFIALLALPPIDPSAICMKGVEFVQVEKTQFVLIVKTLSKSTY